MHAKQTPEKIAVGKRLAIEASRLGLSQVEIAEQVTCSRRTWNYCLSGHTCPDAVLLKAMNKAGFDIMFIVTGNRAWGCRLVTGQDGRATLAEPHGA